MAGKSDLSIDADLVRALAALLEETGLSEIEYAVGAKRVRVARQSTGTTMMLPAAALPAAAPPVPAAASAAEPAGAVKSPMVGTVYLRPQPGAAPFVQPGETVRQGQVLFIIEAMKVMNQIPAPRAGTLREICVADAAPVEYGQVLAVLE